MPDELPYATPDYEAPAPPPVALTTSQEMSEPAKMSPIARAINVFFSPGEVFEDVRRSPRDWWLPLLLMILVVMAAGYFIDYRLEFSPETLAKATVDMVLEQQGLIRKDLSPQQLEQFAGMEKGYTFFYTYGQFFGLVYFPLLVAILSGIYRVILLIAQKATTYFRVFSVVAYSYYVATFVKSILSMVIALVRSPGDVEPIQFIRNQGSLVSASPAALVSAADHPVLFAFLSYFDVFSIWWLVLATIGLVAVSRKLKPGLAALVVISPYLLMMLLAVAGAALSGK